MKTAALILNYNSSADCRSLVASLTALVDYVMIVDNASAESDRKELLKFSQNFNNICVHQLVTNVGYAQGNNVGLRELRRLGYTHVLISNPDITIVDESVVSRLFECLSCARPILSASCLIKGVVPYLTRPDWLAFVIPPLSRIRDKRKYTAYSRSVGSEGSIDVYKQYGCFFAVDLLLFESIGYFSPRTFLYFEESIVAENCRESGLAQVITFAASVDHRAQGSVRSLGFLQYKYFFSSCLIYLHESRKVPLPVATILATIDVVFRILINFFLRVGR